MNNEGAHTKLSCHDADKAEEQRSDGADGRLRRKTETDETNLINAHVGLLQGQCIR